MVSFQCNGCGDVLTKPGLDKHRAMCHSSFDCIDCSKRFETPADYKGHTSCISEAEKYQKTLYNGEKQGGPEKNGRNQRSRQQGGGRQWGNNRPHWQQRNANQATGANDTPLGTPVRMSPVNDTPVAGENTQEGQPAAKTPKKRKAEPETTESKDTSEPVNKKKKQKSADGGPETTQASVTEVKLDKKRKLTSEVTITESSPQGTNSQPVEDGDAPKEVGEKKRRKKERKVMEMKEDEKEGAKMEKKEKRKKKEDPSSSGQEPDSGTTVDAKVTAIIRPPVAATEIPPAIDAGEARSTKKKSKSKESKSKPKVGVADGVPGTPASAKPAVLEAAAQGDQVDRKRKKKRQSGDCQGDGGDGKRVAEGGDGKLKQKCKEKKQRKSAGQAVSVAE